MARVFVEIDQHDADRATLDATGARHLRARRLRPGNEFEAIIAPGLVRIARIETLTSAGATLRLGEELLPGESDPPHRRTLACALADLGRFDTVIEKATELGATEVVPFQASRSQFGRLTPARRERWERLALAACEQCGRTRPPRIFDAMTFEELTSFLHPIPHRVAFDPGSSTLWDGQIPPAAPLGLVVGPEGGFTAGEIQLLREQGVQIRSLGPRTLRFETAAAAVLAIASVKGGQP